VYTVLVQRTIAVGPTIRLIEITPLSSLRLVRWQESTRRAEATGVRRQVTAGRRAVVVRVMDQWRVLFCSPSSVRGAILCMLCTFPVGVGACHACPGAPACIGHGMPRREGHRQGQGHGHQWRCEWRGGPLLKRAQHPLLHPAPRFLLTIRTSVCQLMDIHVCGWLVVDDDVVVMVVMVMVIAALCGAGCALSRISAGRLSSSPPTGAS